VYPSAGGAPPDDVPGDRLALITEASALEETTRVNRLLARILEAHGGMSRWRGYEKVQATIVSGGGLFPFKGIAKTWNALRAHFPGSIETHTRRAAP
jgi:hypothetical protein